MSTVTDKTTLQKLTQLVEERISDTTFSLETVYKELGISRTQLHRIVKEEAQLSTSIFIRNIRLRKAQELLLNTELRITEIADAVGIDSPQNFSKYFIQEYGLSPSEYRRLNAQSRPDVPSSLVAERPSVLRKKAPLGIVLAGIFVVIGLIGIVVWLTQRTDRPIDSLAPSFNNSVVVLPFESQNDDPIFADGVFHELHASLSLLEQLKVISQSSANQYRNTDKTTWEIGDELGVAYVLRGKVKETSTRVEITLSLLRAQDDIQVWSNRYEGPLQQMFNLLNAAVREVALNLKQELSPELLQRLERSPTANLEAYNEFLLGRALMIDRTKEKLAESIRRFDKALLLDPAFAEAQAYKSIATQLTGNMGYDDLKKCFALAEQYALAAIQLDDHCSTAYAILGNVYRDQFKWQQSKTAYEISLKYRPNDAQTIYWYSLLLRSTGQVAEALRHSTKARLLDPLYPVILAGHTINCMYAGREDLAQQAIQEGRLIFGEAFVYYMGLGEYELYHGRYQQALKAFGRMEQLNPNMKYGSISAAYCSAKLGKPEATRVLLSKMGNQAQDFVGKSMLYEGLGQKDSSLLCLERAAAMGRISSEILVTAMYRSIREDSRFKAVLQQYGLPTTSPVQ